MSLSVALLAIGGVPAAGAATVTKVSGEIRALALSGDALVVARVTPRANLVLERLARGAPAQQIFAAPSDDDDELSLAASADALAFALKSSGDEGFGVGRVLVGAPAGPLREVTTCPAGLIVSPVSVAGSRVMWREGACGEPVSAPDSVGRATVVIGGADPGAVLRRFAIAVDRLPVALVLAAGDTGLVGTLLPSFFGFDTEVRAFSPAGLGATVAADRGGLVSPVGILADGTRVFLRSGLDDAGECDAKQLFTLAPGATERRVVPLGGCLLATSSLGPRGPGSPVAAGDRITAFVGVPASRSGTRSETVSIVSMRGDGSDRRTHVKGGFRRPEGVAADGARVAWWQPRCAGGQEIVVAQAAEANGTLAACRAELLTRSARVRDGRIVVRVRCPAGCAGSVFGRRIVPRPFGLRAGTHRLSLRVALGRSRRARVRLQLEVAHGPERSATVSVRR